MGGGQARRDALEAIGKGVGLGSADVGVFKCLTDENARRDPLVVGEVDSGGAGAYHRFGDVRSERPASPDGDALAEEPGHRRGVIAGGV